jgi:cation-transporting ATPase E
MIQAIERIILAAGILIIPVGGLLYWQATTHNGMGFSQAIVSMVGAVIGMIPEGLYLLVTVALALSAMRLARKKVLLHDMRSIEMLARVDVLCVDKTGTITSEDMSVKEVFAASGVDERGMREASAALERYVASVEADNATMLALKAYLPAGEGLAGAEVQPFTSKLKYSQVSAAGVTWRLGAPEFVLPAVELAANRAAIDGRAAAGMRVLVFAEVTGESARALLFVAIANAIRENAPATFAEFERQGVEVKVISGDNPLTVSKVAQEAGIARAERYVDASTLSTPEDIADAVERYTVFGRVKPEQKKQFVEALRAIGLKVAMTGDGVNDILAMKEADCSIAMGGGSDAARQAAQVVLLDSDFSHMREIVGEGRRDINNVTRSATLFLYKNIFSLLLALFSIFGAFVYPLAPNQVSLISAFNIGIPAFLLAFEPNEKKQHGHFIVEVLLRALPAALTSFVAIAGMMLFAELFGISTSEVGTASTYLLSVVGFLILLGLIQPPNRYRVMVLLICIVGLVFCCGVLWQVFDIYEMSTKAWVLSVVFAFAEVGAMQMFGIIVLALRGQLEGMVSALDEAADQRREELLEAKAVLAE